MAESLLDMEKLEHLINLEERLRLHPNLKAIIRHGDVRTARR